MGKYSKAFVSAVVAGGTAYIAASSDGMIDGAEIGVIVGAFLAALGLTWVVPNARQSDQNAR